MPSRYWVAWNRCSRPWRRPKSAALRTRSQLNSENAGLILFLLSNKSHSQTKDGHPQRNYLRVVVANEGDEKSTRHHISYDGAWSIRSYNGSPVHDISRCLETVQHDKGTAKDVKVKKSACKDFGQNRSSRLCEVSKWEMYRISLSIE